MKLQTPQRSVVPPVSTPIKHSASSASLPVWMRIGVPATLAVLAYILNDITIRKQLNPMEVLTLSVDASPGMRLNADDLQLDTVGGTLDHTRLLTMQKLLAALKIDDPESIKEALEKTPLIISRPIAGGELLTDSCLGGIEQLEYGHQRVNVPISNIIGDCSNLSPGQLVYFNAFLKRSNLESNDITEIGPFRIPFGTRKEVQDEKYALLPLVYRVGPNEEKSTDVQMLLAAAYSEHGVKLALVEKSTKKSSEQPTLSAKR
ncbi:hypothetical protein SH528x_000082 [Novipirellula sp. SH528]|uniref:hypothetical protein n=1 Tax=Novipirellula sp. SH528 TaxID=3454466 RepID=UPI003F9ED469